MKKLLFLLGVSALATGAWAADTEWDFSFVVDNYNFHSLNSTSVYLVDTRAEGGYDGTVIAYTTQDWYGESKEVVAGITEWRQKDAETPDAAEFVLDGKRYNYEGGITSWNGNLSVSKIDNNTGTMTLKFTFKANPTDNTIFSGTDDNIDASTEHHGLEHFAFILADGSEVGGGVYTMTPVNLTNAHQVGTTITFANVPEPTTGLLMLLGMAGLALKRKRAA